MFILYFILLSTELIASALTQNFYTAVFKKSTSTSVLDTGYFIYTILTNIVVLIVFKIKNLMNDKFAPRIIYWICICMDILIILYIIFLFPLPIDNNILHISILCALMFISNYAVLYLYDMTISRSKRRKASY